MRYAGISWDPQAETWDQFVDRVDRTRDGATGGVDPLDREDAVDGYPLDERERGSMIDEDFVACEFAGHADRILHSALVCAKDPTRRARLSLARAAVQDAMELRVQGSTEDARQFPRPVKRPHRLRLAPAPGTQDGLGPVA